MVHLGMSEQYDLLLSILEPIAEKKGVTPMELPPLGRAIDVDALHRLIESTDDVAVTFYFAGCEVDIRGGDAIWIREKD